MAKELAFLRTCEYKFKQVPTEMLGLLRADPNKKVRPKRSFPVCAVGHGHARVSG
jgi:hypothetical protein